MCVCVRATWQCESVRKGPARVCLVVVVCVCVCVCWKEAGLHRSNK